MFDCVLDWCALWNGLLLGVVSSIIAAGFTIWYVNRNERKKFAIAVGKYDGYGFQDDSANPLVEQPKPQSKATVKSVERNILFIEVEHADRKWNGHIVMEIPTFGTIVWRYVDLPVGQHSFGFKRFMVREEPDRIYLYIVEEVSLPGDTQKKSHFGREVFVRLKRT